MTTDKLLRAVLTAAQAEVYEWEHIDGSTRYHLEWSSGGLDVEDASLIRSLLGDTEAECEHDWRIGAHEIGQHGYPFKQHQYCEKCDLSRTVLTDEPKDARTDQLWPEGTR